MARRLSRITEPAKTQQTAKLYDPLRRTIRNSNIMPLDKSRQSIRQSRISPLYTSRVSKQMRSLSPDEVNTLANTVFVRDDKKLVPTDHYQKVAGKVFEAIQVEEKVQQPISAQQYQLMRRTRPVNQKIVYQFDNGQNNVYYNSQTSRPQLIQARPATTIINNQPAPIVRSNVKIVEPSPVRVEKVIAKPVPIPQIYSRKTISTNHSNLDMTSVPRNIYTDPPRDRKYYTSSRSKSKQQKYKYNLFSATDDALNTKCKNGCFPDNQIIAKKKKKYYNNSNDYGI